MSKKTTFSEQRRVAEPKARRRASGRTERVKLQTAFANITEAIFIADVDGRLTDFNDEFIRYHRFKDRAECSRTIAEDPDYLVAFFPDGSPAPAEMWAMPRALRGETASNVEYMLRRKNTGETWWGSYNFGPIRNKKGRIIGAVVAGREITARRQAEKALCENDPRLNHALKIADAGSWEWNLTTGALSWSEQAYCLMGEPDDRFKLSFDAFQELIHPDDRASFKIAIEQALARTSHFDLEFRIVRADGKIRHFHSRGEVVYGSDHQAQRMIGSCRDITDFKNIEGALRRSEQLYRAIGESIDYGVWVCTPDGRNTYASESFLRLVGITQEQCSDFGWGNVLHPDDAKKTIEAWKECVRTEGVWDIEHRYRGVDGRWHPILARGVPVRDEEGRIICWAGINLDIGKLKDAEEALRDANQQLEQKVEERTAELARRAAQLRALAGELTRSEQRERSRLAKVLHDHLQQLLVAVKFRTAVIGRGGDEPLKRAARDIEELIDEAIGASRSLTAELSPPILHEAGLSAGLEWLVKRMADKQGLFVDLEVEEIGLLNEDAKLLVFESVRELLFNVIKHAHTNSAGVRVKRINGDLQITISDEGVGFDSAAMHTPGEDGKGFGLFSIRERLEVMGGRLRVESKPGQGSRFVLSLPIAQTVTIEPESRKNPVLPEAQIMPFSNHDPEKRIRVMLVDDHDVVRQGIAHLLSDEPDIEVVGGAADGREAIDLAARLLPDVILMDVSMPKLNGVEATRAICREFPEMRIIGFSMFEDIERARAMRDAGAVDYVMKSGPANVLLSAIRTNIQTSRQTLSIQRQSRSSFTRGRRGKKTPRIAR